MILQDRRLPDVWIISASLQPSVEAMAKLAGVAPDHVIGIRPALDAQGRYTTGFQACGPYPEGNKPGSSVIWRASAVGSNKVIFKLQDPGAMLTRPAPASFRGRAIPRTIFFAAGRGRNLRLVINRNKPEATMQRVSQLRTESGYNQSHVHPAYGEKGPVEFPCAGFGLPDQEDKVYGFYQ